MRLGQLRHTIEIQTPTDSTAAGTRGERTTTFATAETVQAAIMPLSGRELTIARQISERVTHDIEMHYTATLTPRSRLKYGDRYFTIDSLIDVDERNCVSRCLCMEEVT